MIQLFIENTWKMPAPSHRKDCKNCQITKVSALRCVNLDFLKVCVILLLQRGTPSAHTVQAYVNALLRRGYDVSSGKVDHLEADFIATKPDDKIYNRVSDK